MNYLYINFGCHSPSRSCQPLNPAKQDRQHGLVGFILSCSTAKVEVSWPFGETPLIGTAFGIILDILWI